jgi:hypothetical protein
MSACAMPGGGPEPSLAPRPAESIDPRVPIPDAPAPGEVDPQLANRLEALVADARGGVSAFESREAEASRLAAGAGPAASESWVAAQRSLSRLVEQWGVTTRAAAEIDALAAARLQSQKWIGPANRQAITSAAERVEAINTPQAAAIARIREQLDR